MYEWKTDKRGNRRFSRVAGTRVATALNRLKAAPVVVEPVVEPAAEAVVVPTAPKAAKPKAKRKSAAKKKSANG